MIKIGTVDQFNEYKKYQLSIDNQRLLLVHSESGYYFMHDACGHFGVSLGTASCENDQITCPVHGLVFSIHDGSVINRPWDNCVPLTMIPLIEKDGYFWVESIPPRNE